MKISQTGIDLIKKYEGCHLTAYICPSGVRTIGYGHTADVFQGQTISQAQADAILRADIERYEKYVNAYDDTYHWTQNEFDALVSFTFNCGAGNLKKLTDDGKRIKAEIANALPNYNKGGGKVLNGLVRRRNEEKDLFCKGSTPAPKKSVTEVAKEVIDGKWGNGNDRRQKLTKAGYDFSEVQAEVNKLSKPKESSLANEIIARAIKEVGTSESPANSNNVKYNTWFYGKEVSGNEYPWCATFISWLFRDHQELCKKSASCLELLEWFEKQGRLIKKPQAGDLVFFKYNTNNRRTNHIGLVIGVDGKTLTTIEGNTSLTSQDNGGKVMKRTRNKNIVAYARPKY